MSHGVVSQRLADTGGAPFTASWASNMDALSGAVGAGTVGWAFTVSRTLVATKARVYSSSASFTARNVRIWRVSDSADLGDVGGGWSTNATGWQEQDFVSPITLGVGETYVIVTWRSNSAVTRVGGVDASATPWATIPEVTFVEGRESTSQNGVLAATVTDIVRAVDFYAEEP